MCKFSAQLVKYGYLLNKQSLRIYYTSQQEWLRADWIDCSVCAMVRLLLCLLASAALQRGALCCLFAKKEKIKIILREVTIMIYYWFFALLTLYIKEYMKEGEVGGRL